MKYLKKIGAIACVALVSATMFAQPVRAAVDTYLDDIQGTAGLTDNSLADTIGYLISTVLTLLGIILIVLVIYAGFLWMTAGGDSEQTKKAKDIMINAVIGLVIVLASYAISQFVITALSSAGLS